MKIFGIGKINRKISGNIVVIFIIAVIGAFMILPFVYIVNNAFKPIEELYRFPPRIFAQNLTLVNFIDMVNLLSETEIPFLRYVFNTVFITAAGATGQVLMASLCAYSLAKIPYPGSKYIFRIVVFSLMFSSVVTEVPTFIVFAKLGLIDTYWGMILPILVSTMGLYLMKQFMHTAVSDSLLEAARIDGAGEFGVFFRIVMPLLKPAWMTLIILSIQTLWGSTSQNTYSEQFKTMPQALGQVVTGGISRTGAGAAISLVMLIVPIVCFLFMQSRIINTMSSSGLKE